MRKIFVAKKIITMDASHPFVTHVAVENDKIIGVGDTELLTLFPDAEIDTQFQNYVVLPGFVEGHAHMGAGQDGLAPYVGYFDRPSPDGSTLKGLKSVDEVLNYLREVDKKLSQNEPLIAMGFDPIYFDGPRFNKNDLDKVSTSRIIMLFHASGHLITVNSKALDAMPQDKLVQTQGVAKDETGKPNGELQEMRAMNLAFTLLGPSFVKFTDPKIIFPRYVALANMAGCTTISEMGLDINLDDEKTIELLVDLTKDAPLRIVPMYFVPTSERKPEEMPAYVQSLIPKSTDTLRFGLVKFISDGSIQGYTARLKEPYINGVINGMWNQDPENLKKMTKIFHNAGLSISCHCNGDEASEAFIEAVKEALAEKQWEDHRHTIQHGQLVDEAQSQEMKQLGMCINLFPNHIYYWGDQHVSKILGPERAERLDCVNTALSLGIPFSMHCDANVTPISPLFNAWTAVNRVTATGKILGEKEKIPVEDALYAMTMGSAYLLRLEKEIGSITVGKLADFVVLGEDPYSIEPMKLKDIPVITTVFGGKVTLANLTK